GVFSARLRHHAFFTTPTSSTVLDTVTADRRTTSRDHRAGQRRAQGRALAHTPSGKLDADGAWATSATRPRRTIPGDNQSSTTGMWPGRSTPPARWSREFGSPRRRRRLSALEGRAWQRHLRPDLTRRSS